MSILLTIIHVIVCFVLVLVILLQAGRGQGLSGPSFGSGNVQSLFGTRANDFLTKATSISAIFFLLTCIGLNYVETQKSKSLLELKRPGVKLDMDAIKKALEKVKAEQAAGGAKGGAVKTDEAGAKTPAAVPAVAADAVKVPAAVPAADAAKPAADAAPAAAAKQAGDSGAPKKTN